MASKDRRPYLTATNVTQDLLNECQDNQLNGLESIIELEAPDGSLIRISDRNKYVGEHFYEALTNFPSITRSVGDWLGGSLVFSEIEFEVSNVDGRFNRYLPLGNDFSNWVGRSVELKIGLAEQEVTYFSVFKGTVSNEGGYARTLKSIKIRARNDLEKVNVSFPNTVFTNLSHPKAEDDLWGKIIPVVYGDWTQEVIAGAASLPAIVTNGSDPLVNNDNVPVQISIGSPAVFTSTRHRFDSGDKVTLTTDGSLPTELTAGDDYYIKTILSVNTFTVSASLGGSAINTSGSQSGSHELQKAATESFRNIKTRISIDPMRSFDTKNVFLERSDLLYRIPASLITNVSADLNEFEIVNGTASFQIDGEDYVYSSSDKFYCKGEGKAIDGNYNDSGVWIARDILKEYGGLVNSDFDSTWASFRDKASVSSTNFRAYIFDEQNAMQYAVSLLEQVSLEPFVTRDLKFSLNSLQFDDWATSVSYRAKNWDVRKGSFKPKIDQRNNFNRARAVYNYLPNFEQNAWSTSYYKNQAAINQQGVGETKVLIYPNLYQTERVEYFLQETLKLTSAFREVVDFAITPRGFLLDIGEFIRMDINVGSVYYDDVPAMIREIGYNPATLEISLKCWSMAMIPYPNYTPSYAGIVGGFNATITEET